jgi:hypothetical protein
MSVHSSSMSKCKPEQIMLPRVKGILDIQSVVCVCVCVFCAWNTHGILKENTVNYTGYEGSDQELSIEKFCMDLRGRCILTISFWMPVHFFWLESFRKVFTVPCTSKLPLFNILNSWWSLSWHIYSFPFVTARDTLYCPHCTHSDTFTVCCF